MGINLDGYQVTDSYFGKPYIDSDEQREEPYPHRNVHGGFENTDTRFTFYFISDEEYQGRMFQPLEGAHAGHEDAFGGAAMTMMMGGLPMAARLGAYMIESNSGHIGDDMDERAGPDPTLYGYRASAETARLSKFVAEQVYGNAPGYSYVWGGSGGGRRSPLCIENSEGVYQGALPFMGGGNIEPHGTTSRVRSEQPIAFAAMFNVQRLLGDKIGSVIDAIQPGGSGNPYEGLTMHEREELSNLYRLGYPRGDEYMISVPMGQMWLWTATADMLQEEDPDYFDAFWTKPGYIGHDAPEHIEQDLVDATATVSRVITAQQLCNDEEFNIPELEQARNMAMLLATMGGGFDAAIAIEVKGVGDGYRLGTGFKLTSGKAAGRQLYCMNRGRDIYICDGRGDANILRFKDVEPGDTVEVSNRAFLAFCYSYRHHISDDPVFDFLRLDGTPIYPQHTLPLQSPLMGVPYSGQYDGKVLWIHHTHDSSLWPPQGIVYERAVHMSQGPEKAKENFRLQWTDNAEHIGPMMLPSQPGRATNTWLIEYFPIIEQGLKDLCAWAEKGIAPNGSNYEYKDGRVYLPDTAAERGGIQPVVKVKANGSLRAEIKAGQSVELEVDAAVPPGAGNIIAIQWDFDGRGLFKFKHDVDGTKNSLKLTTSQTYEEPGTYFATAKVLSHREGDVNAQSCRIENLASARIIVG